MDTNTCKNVAMSRGNNVIQISTGKKYVVFDSTDDEICILQFFSYAEFPYERQLMIWQPKTAFKFE